MFLMRDEKEERKKQARSNKQTRLSNTAHSRQSLFLRKNELPQVGLEPTTLYTPDRALYQLSYRGSSAGWAQISHLIVHLMNMYIMHVCLNHNHVQQNYIHHACIYVCMCSKIWDHITEEKKCRN